MAYCPQCGKEVDASDKYCKNCGNKLLKGQQEPIQFTSVSDEELRQAEEDWRNAEREYPESLKKAKEEAKEVYEKADRRAENIRLMLKEDKSRLAEEKIMEADKAAEIAFENWRESLAKEKSVNEKHDHFIKLKEIKVVEEHVVRVFNGKLVNMPNISNINFTKTKFGDAKNITYRGRCTCPIPMSPKKKIAEFDFEVKLSYLPAKDPTGKDLKVEDYHLMPPGYQVPDGQQSFVTTEDGEIQVQASELLSEISDWRLKKSLSDFLDEEAENERQERERRNRLW